MRTNDMQFDGFFQDQVVPSSENLQIVAPEEELEEDSLAWALLPHQETVENDEARVGYVFQYRLGRHLGGGIFALHINGWDASGQEHEVELAAAVAAVVPAGGERTSTFAPFWLLDRSLHLKTPEAPGKELRPAYGHLLFGEVGRLPHRRLVGARV
jgi:hypothetical protein